MTTSQLFVWLKILVFHARIKYVEIHYYFVREKVLQGEVDLKYVNIDDQVADIFTKSLNVTLPFLPRANPRVSTGRLSNSRQDSVQSII